METDDPIRFARVNKTLKYLLLTTVILLLFSLLLYQLSEFNVVEVKNRHLLRRNMLSFLDDAKNTDYKMVTRINADNTIVLNNKETIKIRGVSFANNPDAAHTYIVDCILYKQVKILHGSKNDNSGLVIINDPTELSNLLTKQLHNIGEEKHYSDLAFILNLSLVSRGLCSVDKLDNSFILLAHMARLENDNKRRSKYQTIIYMLSSITLLCAITYAIRNKKLVFLRRSGKMSGIV